MSTAVPLPFIWDGEHMVPRQGYARRADQEFVIGVTYLLVEAQARSAASHNHYFAALNEAWQNLPSEEVARFPTVEHLRKYALIRTGFRDERSIACASKAEAERVAAFMRPMDDYALVTFTEAMVIVWTAKSQSTRAMGKAEFQDSKQKVLDYVAGMIGVSSEHLSANAQRAA